MVSTDDLGEQICRFAILSVLFPVCVKEMLTSFFVSDTIHRQLHKLRFVFQRLTQLLVLSLKRVFELTDVVN